MSERERIGEVTNMQSIVGLAIFLAVALGSARIASPSEYRLRQTNCNDNENTARRWNDYQTWQIKDGEVWRNTQFPYEYPNGNDNVWIQPGRCVHVIGDDASATHEEAWQIQVCKSGETFGECDGENDDGVVRIFGESSLALLNDSVVNGEIVFYAASGLGECTVPGELRINKDNPTGKVLEMDGNGGRVRSEGCPGRGRTTLCQNEQNCEHKLLIDGATPGDVDTSMTLMSDGEDLEVSVKLINRGDVLANAADSTLHLTNSKKDGNSGLWRATNGKLRVGYEVRGGGTWRLDPGPGGAIQFDADCLQLSGDFYLPMGYLYLNCIVCTTGHGYYGGGFLGGYPQTMSIQAAPGNKITFHGDCE